MKILIVGGGVAGPAFAAFVKKYNLGEVVLVERAPEFRNIGFVIGLWGNGRKILRELGIDRHVAEKQGYEVDWNAMEDMHAKLLKIWSLRPFRRFGPTMIITRSALQEGLVKAMEGVDIRFGTTVTNIRQGKDKQVSVAFNDGREESFDLVVGADGIKSSVREQVFGKGFDKHYGWAIWVYWLPDSFQHATQVITELDQGKLCAVFPLYERSVAWFVATVPPGTGKAVEQRGDKLRKLFADFGGRVPAILDSMPPDAQIFYDDLTYVDLPSWYLGRVALMGDAQHAASPISGMGASMALEDAFVLADELRRSGASDIEGALQRYAKRRHSRIKKYHRITERLDRWILAKGLFGTLRDLIIPFVPVSYFLGAIKKLMEAKI